MWGEPLAAEVRMEGEGTEAEQGTALPWPPSTGVTDGIWPGKPGGGTAVPALARGPNPDWQRPPPKGLRLLPLARKSVAFPPFFQDQNRNFMRHAWPPSHPFDDVFPLKMSVRLISQDAGQGYFLPSEIPRQFSP